ncbi:TPA: hypothetical protein N0F65_002036 [Lagenidium giganteum]|uniref:Delta(3,5)-Delta(2,4)-dienoyl-CoA isomerase, mitochondrial n=1 Tax=Lagenidium giganteum TaxID=4803 RepID=A0AAV2Z3T3_9STRA|nr:TPA: hypothetical protein N0F65_002036 [Lagenidium giganteum]
MLSTLARLTQQTCLKAHRVGAVGARLAFSTKETSNAALLSEWVNANSKPIDFSSLKYETLLLSRRNDSVLHLKLNRPKQLNAFSMQMWVEMADAFKQIERDPSVKCVVVSGEGKAFTSGMDLNVFGTMQAVMSTDTCEGRKRERLIKVIDNFQKVISAPENCRVPVIAAIHGPCIGAGVDFITACDLRYCDTSADFSVKEIDLAIIADIGTLQRLPPLIGEQQAKELSYTGRNVSGLEAERIGLVLKCLKDKEELTQYVNNVADNIATKSPITIRGIKQTVHYTRDHSTADSLHQIRQHNGAVLNSDDLERAIAAIMSRSTPTFRND